MNLYYGIVAWKEIKREVKTERGRGDRLKEEGDLSESGREGKKRRHKVVEKGRTLLK